MATPKIGLRISGTKQRRGGFQPLVAVGVLAGDVANKMDRVPLVAEKPAYVVRHAPDYALYMLIDRRVKSFDADASGVLTIALTIPSDSQLADKKSPYTLLQEIYNTFLSNYMTRLSDGRDSFLDKDAETEIFRQIVERYPLERRRRALVPMAPKCSTGTLRVPKDRLEDFFRDTNYREFMKFCDIEVGTECACSPGLENLEISKSVASGKEPSTSLPDNEESSANHRGEAVHSNKEKAHGKEGYSHTKESKKPVGMPQEKASHPKQEPRRSWLKPVGYAVAAALLLLLSWGIVEYYKSSRFSTVVVQEGREETQDDSENVLVAEQEGSEDPSLTDNLNPDGETDTDEEANTDASVTTGEDLQADKDDPDAKYRSFLAEAKNAYGKADYNRALYSLNKVKALGAAFSNKNEVTQLRSEITSAKQAQEQKQKEIELRCRDLYNMAKEAFLSDDYNHLEVAEDYIRQIKKISPSYANRHEVKNLEERIKQVHGYFD